MRRRLRIAASCLLGVLVLVLCAAKLVHATWNHERAARSITRWASAAMSGHGGGDDKGMHFGRVDYPFWPALRSLFGGPPVPFETTDFSIWDPDGKEVMAATRVRAHLALGALVWHQLKSRLPGAAGDLELHFSDATVDSLRCRIEPDTNGVINLLAAFRPPPAEGAGHDDSHGGMVITVDGSTILDGTYTMRMAKWDTTLEHLQVRLRSLRYSSFRRERTAQSPAFTYAVEHLESPRATVRIGELRFPVDHVIATEFRAEEPDREHIHMRGTARSLGSRIEVRGKLLDVYGHHRGVELQLTAEHGARVLASLPWRDRLHGDASAVLHIFGPLADVTLEGSVRDVDATLYGIEATHARTRYRYHEGSLQLSAMHAELAGGSADGKATIHTTDGSLRVELEPHDLQPGRMGKLMPLQILAALTGIFSKKNEGPGEPLVEHLSLEGVEISLFRMARTAPPARIVVTRGTRPGAIHRPPPN